MKRSTKSIQNVELSKQEAAPRTERQKETLSVAQCFRTAASWTTVWIVNFEESEFFQSSVFDELICYLNLVCDWWTWNCFRDILWVILCCDFKYYKQ
jgi:hypothetical protein